MNFKNKSDNIEQLNRILIEVISSVVNEPIILHQLEKYFSPKPAKLTEYFNLQDMEKRLAFLGEKMGGPPILLIMKKGEKPKVYDTHFNAIMNEMFLYFKRVRSVICRTHMIMIGLEFYKKNPDIITEPLPKGEIQNQFFDLIEESFWEHCERSYISLCSYWDRVGQVLNFIFFNIRDFERDGFTSIMDRIHKNIVPINETLRNCISMKKIRKYQNSEKTNGLKWLLRRRNIVIHSVHLRKIETKEDEDLFYTSYNHLEEKLRKKLCPHSLKEEIKILHSHLRIAAEMIPSIIEIIEFKVNE